MFKVTTTEAKDTHLPHTIERYKDEGYSAYSLGVYHQMHCLNRIRKAMFPGQYFANETKEDVLDHTGESLSPLLNYVGHSSICGIFTSFLSFIL